MATAGAIPKEMQDFAKEFSKAFAAAASKELLKFQKQMEKAMPKDVIGTKRVKSPEDLYDRLEKLEKKKIDGEKKLDKKYKTDEGKKEDKKRKIEIERYYRELRRTITVREKVEKWLLQRFWGRTFLKAWYGFWNLKVLSTIRDGLSRITGFFESQLHDILGDVAPLLELAKDSISFLKNTIVGVGEALWKTIKSLYALEPIKKFFNTIGAQFKKVIFSPFQKMFKSLKGLSELFKIRNVFFRAGLRWVDEKKKEAKEKIISWAKEKKERAKHWLQMKLEAAKFWLWQKTKGIGKWITKPLGKIGRSALSGIWNAMKWMMPFFIGAIAGLIGSLMSMIAPLLLPVVIGLFALGAGALIQNLIKDPEFQKDWAVFTDWIVKKFEDLFEAVKEKALSILSFGLYQTKSEREKESQRIAAEETKKLQQIKKDVQAGYRPPGYTRPTGVPMAPTTGGAKGGVTGTGTEGVPTGNIPTRLNNPGNIKDQGTEFTEGLKTKYGATSSGVKATDGGTFLQFPTTEAGFAALKDALKTRSFDKTVDERLRQWSNNAYGGEIAPHLSNKRAGNLSDDELDLLAKAMAKREGYSGPQALQKGGKITGGHPMSGYGIDNKLIRASVGEWVTPKGTASLLNSILPGGMAALLRDPIGTLMKFASNFTFGGLGAGALMGFQKGGRVSLTKGELSTPIRGEIGAGLRNLESQESALNKLTASITAGAQQQLSPLPIPMGMNANTFNTSPVQIGGGVGRGEGGAPGDPLPTLMSTPVAWYIVLQNTV